MTNGILACLRSIFLKPSANQIGCVNAVNLTNVRSAWDAVKLTLPGSWLYLSFRGHRPYRISTDLGATTAIARTLLQD